MGGSWAYFRRYQLARPPIGVMSLGDVAVMIGATVVVPYLYLALPVWLVAGLFALGVLSVLYAMAEPVLRATWANWLLALCLLGADIGTNLRFGPASAPFLLANDSVLVLVAMGAANLWAQSGAKARDLAVLAGALAVYDVVATSALPVTSDLFRHLAGMPLAPTLAWGAGSDRLEIGLGDVLLATVFPLVMRKAFGRTAGLAAIAVSLGAIAVLAVAVELAGVRAAIPVMTVIGPLMILQYRYWIGRQGSERTMRQYAEAEGTGRRGRATAPAHDGAPAVVVRPPQCTARVGDGQTSPSGRRGW
jgi:hypothetical protein